MCAIMPRPRARKIAVIDEVADLLVTIEVDQDRDPARARSAIAARYRHAVVVRVDPAALIQQDRSREQGLDRRAMPDPRARGLSHVPAGADVALGGSRRCTMSPGTEDCASALSAVICWLLAAELDEEPSQ